MRRPPMCTALIELPLQDRCPRKHADMQRRLCQPFAARRVASTRTVVVFPTAYAFGSRCSPPSRSERNKTCCTAGNDWQNLTMVVMTNKWARRTQPVAVRSTDVRAP